MLQHSVISTIKQYAVHQTAANQSDQRAESSTRTMQDADRERCRIVLSHQQKRFKIQSRGAYIRWRAPTCQPD
jgi:hypothetical protein